MLLFLNFVKRGRKRISDRYPERFIQNVDYEQLKKAQTHGYKYRMLTSRAVATSMRGFRVNHKFFILNEYGLLTIKKDYMWDGPSGPTVDTASFMRSSCAHDVMFQILREELIPFERRESFFKLANQDLRTVAVEDGMWRVRAWWVYNSVEYFGGKSTRKV